MWIRLSAGILVYGLALFVIVGLLYLIWQVSRMCVLLIRTPRAEWPEMPIFPRNRERRWPPRDAARW